MDAYGEPGYGCTRVLGKEIASAAIQIPHSPPTALAISFPCTRVYIRSLPKSLGETSKTQPKWPKVALVQKLLKN